MTLTFSRIWILVSAYLVSIGWLLSALHQLNCLGYGIACLTGAFAGIVALRNIRWARTSIPRRRFRRWLPISFMAIAVLIVLSGILYAPDNYDALAYRVPRTLHWLAEGRWHWIRTAFPRLNTRSSVCEWTMAPLILFAKTERSVWIANAAMFCALPGLLFSTFWQAGIRRKVAWHWMWVIPTGYVFVLQAGGNSNDLVGAFFALASIALALRASRLQNCHDLWLSALAIALSTGVKASNIPLALPWLIAAFPALRLALRRPMITLSVASLALIVSFAPNAIMNFRHCGDWTGAKEEFGPVMKEPPWVYISGNAIRLVTINLMPPIFPLAGRWNAVAPKFAPQSYKNHLMNAFRDDGVEWGAFEMQIEDGAPAGLGFTLLMLLATASAIRSRLHNPRREGQNTWVRLVQWSPWVALLAYTSQAGLGEAGRLIAPYYLLLPIAILAATGQESLIRTKFWKRLAAIQIGSALCMLIVAPSRPLWPALTALRRLEAGSPESLLVQRMKAVYQAYRVRSDALKDVRDMIPPDETKIGLLAFDELETSLWRPFGSRQFEHFLPGDARQRFDERHIRHLIVSKSSLANTSKEPLEEWLEKINAKVVQSVKTTSRASEGPVPWYLIRLLPEASSKSEETKSELPVR